MQTGMEDRSFSDKLILYHLSLPSASELVREAVEQGWQGNLWHCCIAYRLLTDENVFTLACERREPFSDSLSALALRDMEVIYPLFHAEREDALLAEFHHADDRASSPAARRVTSLAEGLAAAGTAEKMLKLLTDFYYHHGAGELGLGQVFRAEESDGKVKLISAGNLRPVTLKDLVGYDAQKALLIKNTRAFLQGTHANNVLLYGDAGTGKSTSIQALACEYAPDGLRLIELKKHQFGLIPELYARLKTRNYRFILFLDDLSFEENEVDYKQLKAAMEGGAEAAPENVLIYATSNRRHLIRETWNDRRDIEHDGDIHRSDTVEEKLSLSGRFGLQIYYPNPSFEEYHTIVRTLAKKSPALSSLSEEQLRSLASTWQVRRGNRSGRTAQQFINDLLCQPEDCT